MCLRRDLFKFHEYYKVIWCIEKYLSFGLKKYCACAWSNFWRWHLKLPTKIWLFPFSTSKKKRIKYENPKMNKFLWVDFRLTNSMTSEVVLHLQVQFMRPKKFFYSQPGTQWFHERSVKFTHYKILEQRNRSFFISH